MTVMFLITRESGAGVLNTDGSLALHRDQMEAAQHAARLDREHGHPVHVVHILSGALLGKVMEAADKIRRAEFTAEPDTWEGTKAAILAAQAAEAEAAQK